MKPLEALGIIRYLIIFDERLVDIDGDDEPIKVFIDEECPKEYQLIEKSLKALEIIKEKYVIPVYITNSESVEDYNRQLRQITFKTDYEVRKITQGEYDLLKEVLTND